VIALTAHAMAGDREKAMDAGCDDYDTKPVEFSRLLEKMENHSARGTDQWQVSSIPFWWLTTTR
jgi:CheY-like chemotaxis protein